MCPIFSRPAALRGAHLASRTTCWSTNDNPYQEYFGALQCATFPMVARILSSNAVRAQGARVSLTGRSICSNSRCKIINTTWQGVLLFLPPGQAKFHNTKLLAISKERNKFRTRRQKLFRTTTPPTSVQCRRIEEHIL